MHGIGIYMRGLGSKWHRSPAKAAKRAADHGVSFVAIMGCWQEWRKGKYRNVGQDSAKVARYADAFDAKGIRVWLWGYPWGGNEVQFTETMFETGKDSLIAGWVLDPELGYKWKGRQRGVTMRGQPEAIRGAKPGGTKDERTAQAARLRGRTLDMLRSEQGLCVTSYGMAKYHPTFPWKEFSVVGIGSPQLYSVNAKQVDQGIAQWRALGWENIVPSVPAYGRNDGIHMHAHLSNFVDGNENIDGFIFWSWRQLSSRKGSAGSGMSEWDVLARWSDWLKRGACVL
jgi:hypothetical protein